MIVILINLRNEIKIEKTKTIFHVSTTKMGALTHEEKLQKARHNIDVWSKKIETWTNNFDKLKKEEDDHKAKGEWLDSWPTIGQKLAKYKKDLEKEKKKLIQLEMTA